MEGGRTKVRGKERGNGEGRHSLERPLAYSVRDATAAASGATWSQSGPVFVH